MGGTTEVAKEVVRGLKDSPISLALLAINVVYLFAGGWFMSKVADRSESRDKLLIELATKQCP